MLTPAAVSAQSSDTFGRTVSFSAGASSFDASGTGTARTFALRVDAPLRAR